MKLKTLVESGDPELLATGFQFTEGPVWHPDGYLLFSDIPADRIYRWRPEGVVDVWREPSGNSNGLTLDHDNRLVACEHGNRRVSRGGGGAAAASLADRYEGKLLNSPNDLVVKSDGTVYFTDPPYGIEPSESSPYTKVQEQPCNGLYRILTDGTVELLVDDFDRPNGLAFSPGESMLYVDDSPRRHVRVFDVRGDGSLANSRVFADMDHPQPGSPDGMKINVEGTLFVTGATGIWVFEPDGACLGVIVTPERPANCAWGDDDRQSLYITARTSLFRVRTKVPGLPTVQTS